MVCGKAKKSNDDVPSKRRGAWNLPEKGRKVVPTIVLCSRGGGKKFCHRFFKTLGSAPDP